MTVSPQSLAQAIRRILQQLRFSNESSWSMPAEVRLHFRRGAGARYNDKDLRVDQFEFEKLNVDQLRLVSCQLELQAPKFRPL